jgi:hypothetical protein
VTITWLDTPSQHDFVLVTGSGKTYTKADMVDDAKGAATSYERNDEDIQTVRVWGNTAVVTAKLWEKVTTDGQSFDRKFWFSDTYVRTLGGWKYVFGQSSLPLPNIAGALSVSPTAAGVERDGQHDSDFEIGTWNRISHAGCIP